jgi:uncharacterized RDD family membrane protein YckC
VPYSLWGRRAAAWVVDFAPHLLAAAVFGFGYARWLLGLFSQATTEADVTLAGDGLNTMVLGASLWLAAIAIQAYSRWVLGGRTGQSWGKRCVGIAVVSEQTGRPVGVANALVRDLVHLLDALCGVGYLWPLWDDRRQTLGDKLMRTVVVDWSGSSPPPSPVETGR